MGDGRWAMGDGQWAVGEDPQCVEGPASTGQLSTSPVENRRCQRAQHAQRLSVVADGEAAALRQASPRRGVVSRRLGGACAG
jgi:hypothetical protein